LNLKFLINSLEKSHDHLNTFKEQEKAIIQKEIKLLIDFAKKIFPFATKKEINGVQALLIYAYPADEKSFISHEVYLTEKGYITYQVYDERSYRGYRPDANIKNGFVVLDVAEFLQFKSLKEIHEFFEERIERLSDRAAELAERNKGREKFIEEFKNSLK
jgi:hypothetical protein